MTLEGLIVQKLGDITELNNNIYPLCVAESVTPPYVSYVQSGGEHGKDLSGFNNFEECNYEINILSEKYIQLKDLEKKVLETLKALVGEQVDSQVIQDIDIDSPIEQYEEAIKLVRANIKFTIYF